MQLYSQWQDYVRVVLEAIIVAWVLSCVCKEIRQVVQAYNQASFDAIVIGQVLSLLTNVGVVAVVFWWIHTGRPSNSAHHYSASCMFPCVTQSQHGSFWRCCTA